MALSACKHRVSGSLSLPSRGTFHLSLTVLISIGHQVVFSLTGWSPLFHTRFLVSRTTLDSTNLYLSFIYWTFTVYGMLFQNISIRFANGILQSEPHMYFYLWFGLFLFRSPLLQESFAYFLFLWVLRCFSSPRSLLTYYFTHMQILEFFSSSEFPHSDIYESMDICSSSQLFAAYHVLLRLLVPRHSPYALCSLTLFYFGFIVNKFSMFNIASLSFLAFFSYQFTYFFSIYFSMC